MVHVGDHGHVPNVGLFVHDLTDLVYCEVHLRQREHIDFFWNVTIAFHVNTHTHSHPGDPVKVKCYLLLELVHVNPNRSLSSVFLLYTFLATNSKLLKDAMLGLVFVQMNTL